jgi:alkylated DNA repair dioxygenase AlkB
VKCQLQVHAAGIARIITGKAGMPATTTMDDLFAPPGPERLPVSDAEILLYRDIDLGSPPEGLLARLAADTPWRSDTITLWGRSYRQPRLTAWYGDPGATYAYSGISLAPLPWTPTLAGLRRRVEKLCGHSFNSVLLNYYRDQQDCMGLHADDEPELGERPVIASLSLGATRTFILRHRRERLTFRIALPSASLLLMRGATQQNWKHGIDRERKVCGVRINLTFRRVVPQSRHRSGGPLFR